MNDGMPQNGGSGSGAGDGHMHGSNNTPGGGGGGHGDHQMSPYLFTRTTGFFVLFQQADISSTGSFVAALIVSFVFALLSTLGMQFIRSYEHKALSSSVVPKLAGSMLHGFRTAMHYVAMLIVMTMNVWLILAVVVGHALGWFVFAAVFPKSARAADTTGC